MGSSSVWREEGSPEHRSICLFLVGLLLCSLFSNLTLSYFCFMPCPPLPLCIILFSFPTQPQYPFFSLLIQVSLCRKSLPTVPVSLSLFSSTWIFIPSVFLPLHPAYPSAHLPKFLVFLPKLLIQCYFVCPCWLFIPAFLPGQSSTIPAFSSHPSPFLTCSWVSLLIQTQSLPNTSSDLHLFHIHSLPVYVIYLDGKRKRLFFAFCWF